MAIVERTITEREHKADSKIGPTLMIFLAVLGCIIAIGLIQFVNNADGETIAFIGGASGISLVWLLILAVVGLIARKFYVQVKRHEQTISELQQALRQPQPSPYGWGSPTAPNMLVIDPNTFSQGRRGRMPEPTYRRDVTSRNGSGMAWDDDGFTNQDGI